MRRRAYTKINLRKMLSVHLIRPQNYLNQVEVRIRLSRSIIPYTVCSNPETISLTPEEEDAVELNQIGVTTTLRSEPLRNQVTGEGKISRYLDLLRARYSFIITNSI